MARDQELTEKEQKMRYMALSILQGREINSFPPEQSGEFLKAGLRESMNLSAGIVDLSNPVQLYCISTSLEQGDIDGGVTTIFRDRGLLNNALLQEFSKSIDALAPNTTRETVLNAVFKEGFLKGLPEPTLSHLKDSFDAVLKLKEKSVGAKIATLAALSVGGVVQVALTTVTCSVILAFEILACLNPKVAYKTLTDPKEVFKAPRMWGMMIKSVCYKIADSIESKGELKSTIRKTAARATFVKELEKAKTPGEKNR